MTNINQNDQLKKQGDYKDGVNKEGTSPMSPPEAYNAAIPESTQKNADNELIKEFIKDHDNYKPAIASFEKALFEMKETRRITQDTADRIERFFNHVDEEVIAHNKKEERLLFPLLAKRMIENGEHSTGFGEVTTPVDVLESEHLQFVQLAAVISGMFEMLPRIKDQESYYTILSNAVNKGFILTELLKLHIYREDEIVFTLAKNFLSEDDFKRMEFN